MILSRFLGGKQSVGRCQMTEGLWLSHGVLVTFVAETKYSMPKVK